MADTPPVRLDHAYSPITRLIRFVFEIASWITVATLLRRLRGGYFRRRRDFSHDEINDPEYAAKRTRAIEIYILVWLAAAAVCAFVVEPNIQCRTLRWVLYGLAILRIVEVVQVPVNTLVFDAISGRAELQVASHVRTLVLTVLNAFELAFWFGVIYVLRLDDLKDASTKADAWYFSVVTQFTIGYGDITPKPALRFVVGLHILLAFILVVLIIARAVAILPAMHELRPNGNNTRETSNPLSNER